MDTLNDVAEGYQTLCQAYVIYFCEATEPDKYAKPHIVRELSQRWQGVAMQQAADIAQSWRSNRDKAFAAYERKKAWFEAQYPSEAERQAHANKAPQWREFNLPELKHMKIEANHNGAQLTQSSDLPLFLEQAKGSILERRKDGTWWLTLTVAVAIEKHTPQSEPVAIDVGIKRFITTSTDKHYGTFQGNLNQHFENDRRKRQRKAKLRAVLEKKGVEQLPSTASTTGTRLQRHTRQSINKAVKDFFRDHPDSEIVMEDLSISTIHFKSKRMNAKLHASNLAQIPNHLEWVAAQLGLPVIKVNPAYSSQECNRCHFVDRNNRPNQQTFCCQVCGLSANADEAAALNLVNRLHDDELAVCQNLTEIKGLLLQRHQHWLAANGYR